MKEKEVFERICRTCGKEFKTTNRIKLSCSGNCNSTWQNKKKATTQYVDRPCETCGKPFKPMQVRGVGRRWCSIPCRKVIRKVQRAEYIEGAYAGSGGERRWRFSRLYGISIDDYNAMFTAQGGVCALCGNAESAESIRRDKRRRLLCVDHCHTKGHVRKLLCVKCNVGLGNFRENPALLRKAADYLEAH